MKCLNQNIEPLELGEAAEHIEEDNGKIALKRKPKHSERAKAKPQWLVMSVHMGPVRDFGRLLRIEEAKSTHPALKTSLKMIIPQMLLVLRIRSSARLIFSGLNMLIVDHMDTSVSLLSIRSNIRHHILIHRRMICL